MPQAHVWLPEKQLWLPHSAAAVANSSNPLSGSRSSSSSNGSALTRVFMASSAVSTSALWRSSNIASAGVHCRIPIHTAPAQSQYHCCPQLVHVAHGCTDWLPSPRLVLLLHRPQGARRAWKTGTCWQPCTQSTVWLLVNVQWRHTRQCLWLQCLTDMLEMQLPHTQRSTSQGCCTMH
jgi:hypothetical protein